MVNIETAKMSERGQVIIPKGVRDYIGAKENTIFTVMPLDKETILMKKMDKKKLLDEFIKIRNGTKKLSSTINTLSFSYDNTDITQASIVTVDVQTQSQVKQNILSDHRNEQIKLRNY